MPQLNYSQVATLLNDMYNQQVGTNNLSPMPFGTYQQIFQTQIINNTDNLYNYLETVIAKTIYAIRPYSSTLKGMEWGAQRYGDIIRKLSPVSADNLDNSEWSIDAELKKPNPDFACCSAPVRQDFLATRVSGGNTYSRKWTVFRNQLNAAFRSEAEVTDFLSMLITERSNRHEMDKDSEKLSLLANVIIALKNIGGTLNFKALTEYNAETGLSLTATSVMQPENFRNFMIWFAAKIEYLRDMMSRRTKMYHFDISGKEVDRHTPRDKQRLYIISEFYNYFNSNMAGLHSPEYIKSFGDFESLAYWQNPKSPKSVSGTAKTLTSAGIAQSTEETTVNNVIALLTDVDMFGLSNISLWTAPEPYNARYGFQNTWYHDTYKSLFDITENGILITLD